MSPRVHSRDGNSRSTPLVGPKCERMMLARFRELGLGPTASRNMSLASSSRERPLATTRALRRVITSSFRLRIVILAMTVPPCLPQVYRVIPLQPLRFLVRLSGHGSRG